jgi:hypothetical protein
MTHSILRHCVDLSISTVTLTVCQTIANLLDKTMRTSGQGCFFNLYRPSVGGSVGHRRTGASDRLARIQPVE